MLVKKSVIPCANVTLYFCPNCKTGHQVFKDMKRCDICGIDLEWESCRSCEFFNSFDNECDIDHKKIYENKVEVHKPCEHWKVNSFRLSDGGAE